MSNKIVRFHKTGSAEVLTIEEEAPTSPKAGEVRIQVDAIGLNRSEVMFRSGQYLETPSFPSRLGYEASGTVQQVGPGVSTLNVGDKVSTIPAFAMTKYGVYGESAIVPEFAVSKYPDNLSAIEGTAIWMAYITAYGALMDLGKIKANDYVLITAASSSVGLAAIEIAKSQYAKVIATTRKPDKVDFLLTHGADYVIQTETENLITRINTITDGQGANLIFDPIGGQILAELAQVAARNAWIIEYGALANEASPYPLFESLSKGLTIRGYTLFEITQNPDKLSEAKSFIFNALEHGDLKPAIDRTFKFEEIAEAHRYMESNLQKGKIVVTVGH